MQCKAVIFAAASKQNEKYRAGQRCPDEVVSEGESFCWTHHVTIFNGLATEHEVLTGTRESVRERKKTG